MTVELINTGSELLLGRVLNTHQQWLGSQLADMGHVVSRQVAVPDEGAAIQAAVRESLSRADLVITTGGLGPTSDDITRELIAELVEKPLIEDPSVVDHIARRFASLQRPMPERTRVEAQVPEGGLVFLNGYGTAPGLAVELAPNRFRQDQRPTWLIMLPGPPRELRPMFLDSIKPLLLRVFRGEAPFACLTLRSTGVGESAVEERVSGPLQPLVRQGLEIGYCARPGQVDVRLVARGANAVPLVHEAERTVRNTLGEIVFGREAEELEEVVVRLLAASGETLALAESCTGGLVANRVTNVPGASTVLLAGFITYSNAAKQSSLGVRAETLAAHGAVSAAVAQEMVVGAQQRTGATWALSFTGIAGPGGGTPEKSVGTVFIGLAGPHGAEVIHRVNPWERVTFKQVTSQQGLDWLRRTAAKQKTRNSSAAGSSTKSPDL